MTEQDYQDLLARLKRIESRLVQLMLYMNCNPAKRYELEEDTED
jgi:hypothetical protein